LLLLGSKIAGNSWDDLSKHAINSNSGYDDMVIPRDKYSLKKTFMTELNHISHPLIDGKVVLTIKLGIYFPIPG
jgi:hypothetical protein